MISVTIFKNCVYALNNFLSCFKADNYMKPMPPQLKLRKHFTKSLKHDNKFCLWMPG